jgi:hypothetical protein
MSLARLYPVFYRFLWMGYSFASDGRNLGRFWMEEERGERVNELFVVSMFNGHLSFSDPPSAQQPL